MRLRGEAEGGGFLVRGNRGGGGHARKLHKATGSHQTSGGRGEAIGSHEPVGETVGDNQPVGEGWEANGDNQPDRLRPRVGD
jgi:hypothetical protein